MRPFSSVLLTGCRDAANRTTGGGLDIDPGSGTSIGRPFRQDLVDRINHVSRSNLVLQARFRPRQRSGHYGFQPYSPLEAPPNTKAPLAVARSKACNLSWRLELWEGHHRSRVIPDEGVAEIEAEYETAGTVVLDHATDVERRIEAVRPFRSRERSHFQHL